jgi:hypothetical protein
MGKGEEREQKNASAAWWWLFFNDMALPSVSVAVAHYE